MCKEADQEDPKTKQPGYPQQPQTQQPQQRGVPQQQPSKKDKKKDKKKDAQASEEAPEDDNQYDISQTPIQFSYPVGQSEYLNYKNESASHDSAVSSDLSSYAYSRN